MSSFSCPVGGSRSALCRQKAFHCLVVWNAAPQAWRARGLCWGPASRRCSGPAVASAAATNLRSPSRQALSSQVPAKGTRHAAAPLQDCQLTQVPSVFLNSVAVLAAAFCCKHKQRGTPTTHASRTSAHRRGGDFPSCLRPASSLFPEAAERNAQRPRPDPRPLL